MSEEEKTKLSESFFKMDITADRNPEPPQYFKAVDIVLHISGKNLNAKKVDRAVSLSHEKYCSVYNTLRDDMDVNIRYELEETELQGELVESM